MSSKSESDEMSKYRKQILMVNKNRLFVYKNRIVKNRNVDA